MDCNYICIAEMTKNNKIFTHYGGVWFYHKALVGRSNSSIMGSFFMKQKKIKGYENYIVYEDGRIYNVKRKTFLSPVLNLRYMVVLLYNNGKRKMHYVHRLVAEAFCKKNENTNCVNHKDLDRTNNHYKNLEWVTTKENVNHYIKSDKYKPRKMSQKLINNIKERNYKKVICLNTNTVFNSMMDYAKYKDISLSQVSQKLNGIQLNNLNAKFYETH